MKYNFDLPVNRMNTASLKWDVSGNELPMWVADMDFETAPEIKADMIKRAEHGVFGYALVPEEWSQAYIGWWSRRYHFEMEKDWLIFTTGIVPAISSMVRRLTAPNENVLLQTPVFNIFFNSILNNGRRVLENPLIYENQAYHIDFDDLECKLSNPQTTLMILCNPHNPVGKIWDKETLARIGSLCVKHNVIVISDEIHGDITDPGLEYVPFASVSEDCKNNSITCLAPTKTFNLAGLQTAAVAIPNAVLRHKVWRALNTDEVAEPNDFAVVGTISAYTKGEAWLDELRSYLYENKQAVICYVNQKISDIKVVSSQATFLLWMDCSEITPDTDELASEIRRETGLWLMAGSEFGQNGKMFLRMNIACPKVLLNDGLQRLQQGIENYRKRRVQK